MCDHVKQKSLCCSYNIDFKSEVIINMQKEITKRLGLEILCCGTECTVMEETKGTTNKGRKFNRKSNIMWLREVWDRRYNAILKERGILVFTALWVTQRSR